MITSLVCKQYLSNYRSALSTYPILSRAVYDPDMTFDDEFRKYLINEDVSFQQTENTSDWIGIVWNREPIRNASTQNRRFKILDKTVGSYFADEHTVRFGEIALGLSLVSPDLYSLEAIEEYMHVMKPFSNLDQFSVTVPPGDIVFDAYSMDFEITDLSIDKEKKMAQLSANTTIVYPVIILDAEHTALIQEVILEIYTRLVLPDEEDSSS